MRLYVKRSGKVYNINKEEVGRFDEKGYCIIHLGNKKYEKRNVMVAKEYLDWFEGCEVHHKNGKVWDDRVVNLECLTPFQHRLRHNKIKIIGRVNNGVVDRVYNSISDAELDNNIPHNHSHICDTIKGRQETCGGYGWISLDYNEFLPYFVSQNVTLEEQEDCKVLIYNALKERVSVRLPLLSQTNSQQNGLESIFKGFHFK